MQTNTLIKRAFLHTLLWSIALLPPLSQAENDTQKLPLWEIGVAGGLFSTPQYVGSDQRYVLPLVVPYVIYRGDFLKSDREGVRGELFRTKPLSLDLGFGFGLPVKNDNKARQGMNDLYLTGQIGPRINWFIKQNPSGSEFSFHLPIRYAWDTHNKELGWIAEPYFKYEYEDMGPEDRYSVRLDLGLLYAGQKYNDYYYGVADEFATAERAAYQATSGISNLFVNLIGSYRVSDTLKLSTLVRWRNLDSSVINDSPLVRDENYVTVGVGFIKALKKAK